MIEISTMLPSSMHIDHHEPTKLSNEIVKYLQSLDKPISAKVIAYKFDETTQQIVSEVLHDKRLVHKFESNQEYYIQLTMFGVKNV